MCLQTGQKVQERAEMPIGISRANFSLAQHCFFFDLDGTLAPIVDDPSAVAIPDDLKPALARLYSQTGGAVAILTGRGLSDALTILDPLPLPVVGSHGLEYDARLGGSGDQTSAQAALKEVLAPLQAFAAAKDLKLECKPGAIALHYRHAPEHAVAAQRTVDDVASFASGLRALHGKMVSEVTVASVDKGTALTTLMSRTEFAGRVPVMVGDDVTDEDGFSAAKSSGGCGIKIGSGETCAKYRAETMAEFHHWLAKLVAEGK